MKNSEKLKICNLAKTCCECVNFNSDFCNFDKLLSYNGDEEIDELSVTLNNKIVSKSFLEKRLFNILTIIVYDYEF